MFEGFEAVWGRKGVKPNENKFIPFFGGVKHLQNIFVEILMEADLMKRAESFEIELVG